MENIKFTQLMERFNSSKFKYKTIFFNLWSDYDEQVGIDYNLPVMSDELVALLIKSTEPEGMFHFISNVGTDQKPCHLQHDIEKSVESFMRFQKTGFNQTKLLSTFYLFDDSLLWYILVEDSILFVSSEVIFDNLINAAGGPEILLERMKNETKAASGYAYSWRNKIINDFIQTIKIEKEKNHSKNK